MFKGSWESLAQRKEEGKRLVSAKGMVCGDLKSRFSAYSGYQKSCYRESFLSRTSLNFVAIYRYFLYARVTKIVDR